jgi:hypothetical protein
MNFAELLGASTKLVFDHAVNEARIRGQDELEPEHFLYSLLAVDKVRAGKILTHIGVKPSTLQLRVDALLARMKGRNKVDASSDIPALSRRSMKLLSSAFQEMVKDNKKAIASEHLLLALTVFERFGKLGKLLKEFDVTFDSLELCIKDSAYIDQDGLSAADKAESQSLVSKPDQDDSEPQLKKLIELFCDSALALVLTSGLRHMLEKAPALITAEQIFEAVLRNTLFHDWKTAELVKELVADPTKSQPHARRVLLEHIQRREKRTQEEDALDEDLDDWMAELELLEKKPGFQSLSKKVRLSQPVERFLLECAYYASGKGRNRISCIDIVTVYMTREKI